MLYDSWICIFIHWKKTTEDIWKIFVVINMIFKANIYIVIAEGKGTQYFELATAELQFVQLQGCSHAAIRHWTRPNTSALQWPSLGQSKTHSPPNPYQFSLCSWKWFGKLSWDHCDGTISRWALLFLQMFLLYLWNASSQLQQKLAFRWNWCSQVFLHKAKSDLRQVELPGVLVTEKHPRTEPVQVLCAACSNVNANLSWNGTAKLFPLYSQTLLGSTNH